MPPIERFHGSRIASPSSASKRVSSLADGTPADEAGVVLAGTKTLDDSAITFAAAVKQPTLCPISFFLWRSCNSFRTPQKPLSHAVILRVSLREWTKISHARQAVRIIAKQAASISHSRGAVAENFCKPARRAPNMTERCQLARWFKQLFAPPSRKRRTPHFAPWSRRQKARIEMLAWPLTLCLFLLALAVFSRHQLQASHTSHRSEMGTASFEAAAGGCRVGKGEQRDRSSNDRGASRRCHESRSS